MELVDKITWTNSRRKLSELIPWERNPRYIKAKDAERLSDSLDSFGQIHAIAIGPNNEIYDGHQRSSVWGAADKYGPDYEVDVRISSRTLTEKEREKLTVYLHTGAVGSMDFDMFAGWDFDEIQDWGFDTDTLHEWNDNAANLREMLDAEEEDPPEDAEPQIDKAEELRVKWGVELGQLWQLGEHRIVCGDCTDADVVARVMWGEKAQAVVSDPPFFVRDDKWDTFENEDEFVKFTSTWIWLGMNNADVVVSFMADHNVPLLRTAAEEVGAKFRRSLVWRKPPGSQFAGSSLDGFWFDFEMINVFGEPAFKPDKSTKMAVLEHRTVTGQEHGCEKPVGLLEDLVGGYSENGAVVADLFGGVGTTLIACERLNRKCRAVEISPAYVAVAIQRWVDVTGGEPVLLG